VMIKLVQDEDFRDLVEWICCWETGPWVAGGSVRKVWFEQSWKTQDVDFFFKDREQFDRFNTVIPALGEKTDTYYNTSNAITYKIQLRSGETVKIQAICKDFYPSVQAVLDDFDFTLAQFASDGVQMITNAVALEDIRLNRINLNPLFTKQLNPMRVLKYAAYGFDPSPRMLAEAAKSFASGELQEFGY
jgi:hypothetical protein